MDSLNFWLVDKLGLWTVEYAGLFLIIAAVLALILLITLIIVIARHCIIKKHMRALQAKANSADSRPSEEELKKQIREELEKEYKDRQPAQTVDSANIDKIAALEVTVKQQQAKIDELTAQLEKASDKPDNGNLYRTIAELNQKVKTLESENAELKAGGDAAKPAAKKAAPKKTAKKPEPEPEPEYDEDDEEYDDDEFADETSNIKVTLKFDRAKNNWVITRSDMTRAYRRLATKQEALLIAKDLARSLHAHLAVHKKDGKFQKV